jgi:hypothetical protein
MNIKSSQSGLSPITIRKMNDPKQQAKQQEISKRASAIRAARCAEEERINKQLHNRLLNTVKASGEGVGDFVAKQWDRYQTQIQVSSAAEGAVKPPVG